MEIDWDTIYEDPEKYDRLTEQVGSVSFFVERARACGGPVLELGCGTGRVTLPIAQAGVEVVGLDCSELMLDRGREKARQAGVQVEWVHADFLHFSLERKFPLIFLAYHSIHHINDFYSFVAFFDKVREHLAPGGKLILEDWNPASPDFGAMENPRPTGAELMRLNRVRWLDGDVQQRLSYLYPKEYEELLWLNGFQIEELLGDLDGSPYSESSRRLIVVARDISSSPK